MPVAMTAKLRHYVEIGQSPDLQSFQRSMVSFAHMMGFAFVNAVIVKEERGTRPRFFPAVSNVPASFAEAREADIAVADPVVTQLRHEIRPFAYDQRYYVDAGAGHQWEIAAAHGYKTGISVGVRLGANERFLLGMDRANPLPNNGAVLARLLADLQLLAVHCGPGLAKLVVPDARGAERVPKLTSREREVLRWTSIGKTAGEVGDILTISERTANSHVQSAMRKLQTPNKYCAVIEAMRLGLLE